MLGTMITRSSPYHASMRSSAFTFSAFFLSGVILAQQDSLPPVNKGVVDFVREHLGEKVGRGECWDLAAEALNVAGAKWDGDYGFGRKIDPGNDPVFPGDIVQFERVEFRWEVGNEVHAIRMPHHTAVVLEVPGQGGRATDAYFIAQQNTQETGRKTGTGEMLLSRRSKGRIVFFRPVE